MLPSISAALLIYHRSQNNLQASPLLQLPAELRVRIFEYVLTGNVVHVEQLPCGHVDKYEKKDVIFGQGLWNEICHSPDVEHGSYISFVNASILASDTPFGRLKDGRDIGTGYHIESWSARHSTCSQEPQLFQFNATFERWVSRNRLQLSSLRTCKLLYHECHRLPYTGNAFLFRTPSTFQAFYSNINIDSVQAIQYLSLPVAVGSAPFSPARSRAWSSVLWDYNLAYQFTNLKELRVTLELYFPRDIMGDRKPTYLDCKEEVGIFGHGLADQLTNWLEQFSRLRPLLKHGDASNHVTVLPHSQLHNQSLHPRAKSSLQSNSVTFKVMVCDDPLSMWGPVGQIQYCRDRRIRNVDEWMSEREAKCLTVEQKQKLAKEIEGRLRKQSMCDPQCERP